MKEPQHGKLISECCSALPFMDIDPEWSSGCETWIGMCGRCKEHANFVDEDKEDRQMTGDQIMVVYNSIEEGEPDISTERLLAMVVQATGADYRQVCEAIWKSTPEGQRGELT